MLEDQMASEKLSEGITGFSKAIEELEKLLLKRYSEIKKQLEKSKLEVLTNENDFLVKNLKKAG